MTNVSFRTVIRMIHPSERKECYGACVLKSALGQREEKRQGVEMDRPLALLHIQNSWLELVIAKLSSQQLQNM
jgi:hypothetical protein